MKKKREKVNIQHWIGPVPQIWVLPCSPPGLGMAATMAAKEATAKRASLENMAKDVIRRVSEDVCFWISGC